MKSVVVFCGSSDGVDAQYAKDAFALGETLAKNTIKLIYGGAKIGIMGQVASGALEHGGEVIGVIPEFLMKKEVYHPNLNGIDNHKGYA